MAEKKTTSSKKEDILDQLMVFGSSMVYLAKDGAEDLVGYLEESGLLDGPEGRSKAEEIRNSFESRREKVRKNMRSMVTGLLDDLGIATKEDLEKLKK